MCRRGFALVDWELPRETHGMAPSPPPSLARFAPHFAVLEDPRRALTRCRHSLLDLIVRAVVGVVCGADGWDELADFAALRADWFATRLGLPGTPPSESTFRRVLTAVAPATFSACFASWARSLATPIPGEGLAIDGKTLRGGANGVHHALHVVHAWATERGLLLGQLACASKGNELEAMETLLGQLELRGVVVTIDAAGTHKPIAQRVIDATSDYILAVKGNQKTLHEGIALRFLEISRGHPDPTVTEAAQFDKGHGRVEDRQLWAAPAASVAATAAWPGAASVIAVRRRCVEAGESREEWRYFLGSLPPDDPTRLAHLIRGHWGVENGLHWSLDVGFREDHSRIHEHRAQENFSTLRKFGLMMIKKTPRKSGIAASRKKAGWDDRFLFEVLAHGIVGD